MPLSLSMASITLGGGAVSSVLQAAYTALVKADPGLLAYWPHDDPSASSVLRDTTGNYPASASAVTFQQPSVVSTDPSGKSGSYNGTNSAAALADSSKLNWERTQAFTLEVWLFLTFDRVASFETRSIISKLLTGGTFRGFEFDVQYRSTDNKTCLQLFQVNDLSTNSLNVRGQTDVPNSVAVHAAFTGDGTGTAAGTRMYVNGAVNTLSVSSDTLTGTMQNAVTANIGVRPGDAAITMKGRQDNLAIYNRAMTAREVRGRYLIGTYAQPPLPISGPIIFGTDLNTDSGDAGAMAVLFALIKNNEAALSAIAVCVSNPDSAEAVDAIDTYYGRPNIPISRYTGTPAVQATGGAFIADVKAFPHDLVGTSAPDATTVMRQARKDGASTIIEVGFLQNVMRLLQSPGDGVDVRDGITLCTGMTLVIMGGVYDGTSTGQANNAEYNFLQQPAAASYVCANWPGPVVFFGYEVGLGVITGDTLTANTPTSNPVRKAYESYLGANTGNPAWDEMAVLGAIRGRGTLSAPSFVFVKGQNVVNAATGANTFTPGAGNHWYAVKIASDATFKATINGLMTQAP